MINTSESAAMADVAMPSYERQEPDETALARKRRMEQRRKAEPQEPAEKRRCCTFETGSAASSVCDENEDSSYREYAADMIVSGRPSIRGIKKQARYEPGVPMTKEELAKWRKEARRVRNRESAAASRRKTRERIDELEQEVDDLQTKYQAALRRIQDLEAEKNQLLARVAFGGPSAGPVVVPCPVPVASVSPPLSPRGDDGEVIAPSSSWCADDKLVLPRKCSIEEGLDVHPSMKSSYRRPISNPCQHIIPISTRPTAEKTSDADTITDNDNTKPSAHSFSLPPAPSSSEMSTVPEGSVLTVSQVNQPSDDSDITSSTVDSASGDIDDDSDDLGEFLVNTYLDSHDHDLRETYDGADDARTTSLPELEMLDSINLDSNDPLLLLEDVLDQNHGTHIEV